MGQSTVCTTINDNKNLLFINVVEKDAVGRENGITILMVFIIQKRSKLLSFRIDLVVSGSGLIVLSGKHLLHPMGAKEISVEAKFSEARSVEKQWQIGEVDSAIHKESSRAWQNRVDQEQYQDEKKELIAASLDI
eukprot:2983483-Ditylum_brightwellii.AAC.3